jgi:uncharacterized protein YbbK (DUF523 family)/uncharacterized protein YbgA (DUF1722 family)
MRTSKLRVGVSSCLLGHEVRWDGEHRRDAFVADVLGPFVEWVPVCPELEVGMGVPREPVRLVGAAAAPRLVGHESGADRTAAMLRFAEGRVRELEHLDLDGYVTKKDSPSCGMERVRVWPPRGGAPRREGVGAFARVLVARMPLLPVEEEGRLRDPALRECFLERIFAHARWRGAIARGMRRGGLARFHAANELALRAHGPAACRRLGALVGSTGTRPIAAAVDAYGRGFMEALRVPATRGRHAAALRLALGRLRRVLPPADRVELAEAIGDFARGLVPVVVPLTLVRHHARRGGVESLAGQTYLDPDPRELMLRNHA